NIIQEKNKILDLKKVELQKRKEQILEVRSVLKENL
ncbi:hypothetical protein ACLJ45_001545, partial [Campylobacter coli]